VSASFKKSLENFGVLANRAVFSVFGLLRGVLLRGFSAFSKLGGENENYGKKVSSSKKILSETQSNWRRKIKTESKINSNFPLFSKLGSDSA